MLLFKKVNLFGEGFIYMWEWPLILAEDAKIKDFPFTLWG